MGQVLHGSAATAEQLSGFGTVEVKTVAKWRKQTVVADRPTGPSEPRSTVLSAEGGVDKVEKKRFKAYPISCIRR